MGGTSKNRHSLLTHRAYGRADRTSEKQPQLPRPQRTCPGRVWVEILHLENRKMLLEPSLRQTCTNTRRNPLWDPLLHHNPASDRSINQQIQLAFVHKFILLTQTIPAFIPSGCGNTAYATTYTCLREHLLLHLSHRVL